VSQFEIRPRWHARACRSAARYHAAIPKGPKGQKRPADVIGNAVRVMRIATGEDTDDAPDDGKNKAAQNQAEA
jgi:hypothetical protein